MRKTAPMRTSCSAIWDSAGTAVRFIPIIVAADAGVNGRNGMDELARAESWVVMILLLVSIFTRSAILDILAIGLMIHMYFRVFSRNVNKRYAENQKFFKCKV